MPQRLLGIRTGDTWAFLGGAGQPLRPAVIIKPGAHYDALIRIRLLDDPEHHAPWVPRRKLPCLWEDRLEWLVAHPQHKVPDEPPFEPDPDPDQITISVDALRRVIREEVQAAVSSPPPVAYSMSDAAKAAGVSAETLRRAVRLNTLVPNYVGRKPLFRVEELQRWVRSLPEE